MIRAEPHADPREAGIIEPAKIAGRDLGRPYRRVSEGSAQARTCAYEIHVVRGCKKIRNDVFWGIRQWERSHDTIREVRTLSYRRASCIARNVHPEATLEVGRIIGGKYRLHRQIGEGGMGSVWSAVHDTLDRTVAIKFLRSSTEDNQTASARFVTEAKSAARVKHRFVVDVFDFGITEDGVYYMVQELLEGEELADCIDHGAAWEVRDVVQFMAQCLNGLEAVHQAGIVHRDLKPENIFVIRDVDGRYPKLLDFGISKLSEPMPQTSVRPPSRAKQITTTGTTLGTPWYMSPEQLRGRRDLDGRADVYSVGVILYEWLTGRVPYEHDNLAELALQVASGSAPPLVSLRPELGHNLSSVIAKALSPEPEGRFSSAAEMRDALVALLPSLPTAWSIVQKSARSAPIGAKTELLLQAAADAFGQKEGARQKLARLRKRIRPKMIAAALGALGLVCLPLLREARPDRASAKEEASPVEAAPLAAPSSPMEQPALPALALEPSAAETDSRSARRASRRDAGGRRDAARSGRSEQTGKTSLAAQRP